MKTPSLNSSQHVIIVGAGHGGAAAAAALRQFGFQGPITMVGDEQAIPYHRPPLSKAWLKGDTSIGGIALRPELFYEKHNITMRLGVSARRIERQSRHLILQDGERLAYDALVLATGAVPRRLCIPGSNFPNVVVLRSLKDAESLRTLLTPGGRLVVLGGGYVGLECAATARLLGMEVVVLERAGRLLERVASAPVADFLQCVHERQGVRVVCGATVTTISGEGRADAVHLADGRHFSCTAVLLGIGAVPASALAEDAGLTCDDGVCVDEDCRSSDPHIFAVGDVARGPHPLYHCALRLESVPSANEQAKRVAAVLAGRTPEPAEIPWFWSDQYDCKLQMVGLPLATDDMVVRGAPTDNSFSVFHLTRGSVTCVESVNTPRDFMIGKKLIASHKNIPRGVIADMSVSLAEVAA